MCSVLFCDMVGFTPLPEARDPEAVRELLSRYFGVARTVIGRYGGLVESLSGTRLATNMSSFSQHTTLAANSGGQRPAAALCRPADARR